MKKHFLFLYLTVYILNTAFAQTPLVKQWDKRFGGTFSDVLYSFQQTADAGYILGGRSLSGANGDKTQVTFGNSFDYWVVKTNALGVKQWDKDFGGTSDDYLYSLQQTADGGYILGGSSTSPLSGNKTQNTWGLSDYWIVKIDSLGNKIWDKDFGGTNNDYLHSIFQTADGGYLLAGYSSSDSSGDKSENTKGDFDYWIIKIDSSGNKQWDKDFGGTGDDELFSAVKTTDEGFLLGGYSYSDSSGDKTQNSWGMDDYWILKTDSLGNKQWDKNFGGTNHDALSSLRQAADGGYIVGGTSYSDSSGDKTQNTWDVSYDYWIIKTDSAGNKEWDKDFGGTGDEDLFGNIIQTYEGGYLMAGTSYSNVSGDKSEDNIGINQSWMVKTDANGNKEWDKTIFTNGYDQQGLVIETMEGCIVVANTTDGGVGGDKTEASRGIYDYWMIHLCDSALTTNLTPALSKGEGVSIAPNPASESVVISSEFGVNKIEIFNLLGKNILSASPSPSGRVGVGLLPNGLYIIKAYTEKGVFQQKLVINH
jgi:hypothetical protein